MVDSLLSIYALATTILLTFNNDVADYASLRQAIYLLRLLAIITSTVM